MPPHANERGQQAASPGGEPPADGGPAAAHSEAGTALADSDETPPADTGVSGTAATGTAPVAAGTVGVTSGTGEGAGADPGPTTLLLDPGEDDLPAEHHHAGHHHAGHYHAEHYRDDQLAEPVSKLSILALVTGVLPLIPLALVFGIGALAGIRRSGRRGRGMALAGLIAATAWLIVGGAVGTVGALTHGFHKPVTIKYHEPAVFKLQAGDCIDSQNGQLVSCFTPHQAEVFATFSLPVSAWPGVAAVVAQASSGCATRLTGYLNPQLTISVTQSYVYPNEADWTAGTHTVICEVRATSGELTGSVGAAS